MRYLLRLDVMSNEPLLSIITVSAFDSQRLANTLNSLIEVRSSIEHVVVVPKSDLESIAILKSHSVSAPHPVILVNDEKQGVYPAMNIGANAATGKYLCFWNAGDELNSPEELNALLESLNARNPKWVICQGNFQWRNDQELSSSNLAGFVKHKSDTFISHQTVIMQRVTFMGVGMFDSRYRVAADTAMITQLYLMEEPRWEHSVVVKVETPEFASHNHRQARIEVLLIVFRELRGSQRSQAIRNIFHAETRRLIEKLK